MDKILIGTILRPQGIKGELKINPITDDINRFNKLKEVYIDGVLRKVLSARVAAGEVFVYIDKVINRNDAELMRGKEIYIDKKDAVIPKGRFLISDIIGCGIFANGELIGKMTGVLQYAKTDTYVAKDLKNKEFMFPALSDVILEIDIVNKKIVINKKRFLEVCSYED